MIVELERAARQHPALRSHIMGARRARTGPAMSVGRQALAILHRVARVQCPRPHRSRTEDPIRYDRLPGLLVLCSLLPAGTVRGQTAGARPDYRDPALPVARRVEDLLSRMSPEEKVTQMM